MAVEIGVFENAIEVFAIYVEMALEYDAVLRQRARLVGAQHIHCAEVLDRS